jgi:hypothetical protein
MTEPRTNGLSVKQTRAVRGLVDNFVGNVAAGACDALHMRRDGVKSSPKSADKTALWNMPS